MPASSISTLSSLAQSSTPPSSPLSPHGQCGPVLSAAELQAFARDGYLVKHWFDAPTILAARTAAERILYGTTFADYLADPAAKPLGDGMNQQPGFGRAEFPTGETALDSLLTDGLLTAIENLLGQPPVYLNSHIFARAGSTDRRHSEHPWQGYHYDHDTYSMLPPSADAAFEAVTASIFLTDVTLQTAPLHVVPGTHRTEAPRHGNNAVEDLRTIPGLPAPVPAIGPAGSILFYSTYLLHAAVPFIDKRSQRIFYGFTSAGIGHAAWSRFATPYRYGMREHFMPYWDGCGAAQRTYCGWPAPGHPYYTDATLAALAQRYPRMDLSAYRQALSPISAG